MKKNDVVQFIEEHKWCGCLGIVEDASSEKLLVGVPVPEQGVAYIFCKPSDVEVIGQAALVIGE